MKRVAGFVAAFATGVLATVALYYLFVATRSAPQSTDVRIVVRGFVTNSFPSSPGDYAFPGDYVCAIIDVTNASKHWLICSHRGEGWSPMGNQASKSYYSYRDGEFRARTLSPHSGFTFETLVFRDYTNEVTVDIMQLRLAPRPLWHLPASIQQKLPEFLRTSVKLFTVTTTPFTVRKNYNEP